MKPWQKAFFQIQIIVNAIYSSIIVYVGLIYFIHISPASSPGQTQQIMFFALLTFGASFGSPLQSRRASSPGPRPPSS